MNKAVLAFLALASACATADTDVDDLGSGDPSEQSLAQPRCPTAPSGTVTWWRWTTQRHNASVVWSTDGTELLVSELTYEAKTNWFTGYEDARNYCYRLSLFTPAGNKVRDVMAFTPGFIPGDNTSIAYMKNAGYMIVHVQDATGAFQVVRVALDGTRRQLTSATCGGPHVTPSPDGRRMALYRSKEDCSGSSGPLMGSSFDVSFFDAAGTPTGGTATASFASWGTGTWTPAGGFVMTDGQTAISIAVTGAKTTTSVPGCTEPATTSSDVASDGRIAGLTASGKPAVIGSDPARAFGCQ